MVSRTSHAPGATEGLGAKGPRSWRPRALEPMDPRLRNSHTTAIRHGSWGGSLLLGPCYRACASPACILRYSRHVEALSRRKRTHENPPSAHLSPSGPLPLTKPRKPLTKMRPSEAQGRDPVCTSQPCILRYLRAGHPSMQSLLSGMRLPTLYITVLKRCGGPVALSPRYRAHASQPCILQHLGPRASFVVICPCYRVRASGPCILRYLRAREDQFDSVGTCYRVSALPPCIFTVLGSYGGFILLGIFYRVRAFPPCILRYLGAGEALFYSLPVIVYAPSRLVFYRPSRLALYGT